MAAAGSLGRLVGGAGASVAALPVVALLSAGAVVAMASEPAVPLADVTTPAGTFDAPPLSSLDEQLARNRRAAPATATRGAVRMRGSTLPTARRSYWRGVVSNGRGRPTRSARLGTAARGSSRSQ